MKNRIESLSKLSFAKDIEKNKVHQKINPVVFVGFLLFLLLPSLSKE